MIEVRKSDSHQVEVAWNELSPKIILPGGFEPWLWLLPSHLPRFMSRLHPGHPYYRFTCQTFRRGKGWIRILNCVISIRLGLEVAWRTREGGGRREVERERAWERFTTIRFGALLAADLWWTDQIQPAQPLSYSLCVGIISIRFIPVDICL